MLEFIGAVAVTMVLILPTFWFYGLFFISFGFAGIDSFNKIEWVCLLVGTLGFVVGWYLWWEHIGSRINVSFG